MRISFSEKSGKALTPTKKHQIWTDQMESATVWNHNFDKNKTCHRDRIARLTAPCPSHKKNFNIKLFANAAAAANADANAVGSTIALPGLRPGKLKRLKFAKKTEDSHPY